MTRYGVSDYTLKSGLASYLMLTFLALGLLGAGAIAGLTAMMDDDEDAVVEDQTDALPDPDPVA